MTECTLEADMRHARKECCRKWKMCGVVRLRQYCEGRGYCDEKQLPLLDSLDLEIHEDLVEWKLVMNSGDLMEFLQSPRESSHQVDCGA